MKYLIFFYTKFSKSVVNTYSTSHLDSLHFKCSINMWVLYQYWTVQVYRISSFECFSSTSNLNKHPIFSPKYVFVMALKILVNDISIHGYIIQKPGDYIKFLLANSSSNLRNKANEQTLRKLEIERNFIHRIKGSYQPFKKLSYLMMKF